MLWTKTEEIESFFVTTSLQIGLEQCVTETTKYVLH